jgi:hypothetical protein
METRAISTVWSNSPEGNKKPTGMFDSKDMEMITIGEDLHSGDTDESSR